MLRLLFFMLMLSLMGCAGRQVEARTTTATAAEIEAYFSEQGFTFSTVTEDEESHRVGLSEDGFIQIVLYGDTKPAYASITVSGGPDNDDLLEVLPYMDALAALVTPTWTDAPSWIRTQVRSTPTHIMNMEETTHSGYHVFCGGSPEVVNLIFSTD